MSPRRKFVGALALLLAMGGCEREHEATWIPVPTSTSTEAMLDAVTQVPPGPIALTVAGPSIYFVGTTPGRADSVLRVTGNDAPLPTKLSPRNALAAAGFHNGTGQIVSLLHVNGGLLYHFSGGTDTRDADHLGFLPDDADQLSVLLPTEVLAATSGLGGTLLLARSQMIRHGEKVYILLRTPGDAALLQMDVSAIRSNVRPPVTAIALPLRTTLAPYDLARPDRRMVAGPRPNVLWFVGEDGTLDEADLERGFVTRLLDARRSVLDVPPALPQVEADGETLARYYFPPPPPEQRRTWDVKELWRARVRDYPADAGDPNPNADPTRGWLVAGRTVSPDDFLPNSAWQRADGSLLLHDPNSGLIAELTVPPTPADSAADR